MRQAKPKRLIVFFIPAEKIVSGGLISIFSLCETSRQFRDIHHAEVVISVFPGLKSYRANDLFSNSETIVSFDEIITQGPLEFLMLHVPEYESTGAFNQLKQYKDFLQEIPDFRVNILNQNILLMKPPTEIAEWFTLTPHVTQTTAHNRYSTQDVANQYAIPTHHLSTFVDPAQYSHLPYEKKQNIIVLSPDKTTWREAIVEKLKHNLPDYDFVTVQNMKYEDYKELMAKAKFTITFGEGFDGYFVEAAFTEGIAFAVYNNDFFPAGTFARFENVYPSHEVMSDKIVEDIRRIDKKQNFSRIARPYKEAIERLYSYASYTENLKKFYLEQYSFMPTPDSYKSLISAIIKEKDELLAGIESRNHLITGLQDKIKEGDYLLSKKDEQLAEKDQELLRMLNSRSWKITSPLRQLHEIISPAKKA